MSIMVQSEVSVSWHELHSRVTSCWRHAVSARTVIHITSGGYQSNAHSLARLVAVEDIDQLNQVWFDVILACDMRIESISSKASRFATENCLKSICMKSIGPWCSLESRLDSTGMLVHQRLMDCQRGVSHLKPFAAIETRWPHEESGSWFFILWDQCQIGMELSLCWLARPPPTTRRQIGLAFLIQA